MPGVIVAPMPAEGDLEFYDLLDDIASTLTTAQAARCARVSVGVIRQWRFRGKLKVARINDVELRDDDGHPRYYRADVERVAAEMAARKRARRNG